MDISICSQSIANNQDENETFVLETDKESMRNNSEYQLLLKTLYKLQRQRIQAIERLEKMQAVRNNLKVNPRHLVNSLQNGEVLNLPPPIEVAELPTLEWDKYNLEEMINDSRPVTRKKQSLQPLKQNINIKKEVDDYESSSIFVRGRLYDEAKPKTFNQQWSVEEQKKLEELLIKYPDEHFASRRFSKIAKEMGTRTLAQVQSRIQKYFIVLKKYGLPVPGRNPTTYSVNSAGKKQLSSRRGVSFMRAFDTGDEDDSLYNGFGGHSDTIRNTIDMEVSDEEDIDENVRDSEEYKEFMKLKKIRKLKVREVETGNAIHLDFKCDRCGMDPIEGSRWHCLECDPPSTIDFCCFCYKENLETISHSSSHKLQPIRFSNLDKNLMPMN